MATVFYLIFGFLILLLACAVGGPIGFFACVIFALLAIVFGPAIALVILLCLGMFVIIVNCFVQKYYKN